MTTAFVYIVFAALGYLAAIFFKKRNINTSWTGAALTLIVMAVIFLMGFRIGANREIVSNLGLIGLASFGMAVFSLAVCIMLIHFLRKAVGLGRDGLPVRTGTAQAEVVPGNSTIAVGSAASDALAGSSAGESATPEDSRAGASATPEDSRAGATATPEDSRIGASATPEASRAGARAPLIPASSVRYLAAVIIGFTAGYFCVIQGGLWEFDSANLMVGHLVNVLLCLLIFFVGMDIGLSGDTGSSVQNSTIWIFIFPFVTAAGTFIAIWLSGILLGFTLKEVLGIVCTFCWYSLGPNIMISYGLEIAGAYCFLTNFFRVILSLLTIPIVAERIGYLECTCMAQAATMDVCIASVSRSTNTTATLYGLTSGVMLSATVPVLMPLLMGML